MEVRAIRNDETYRATLARVSDLIDLDPVPDCAEGEELEILGTLVQAYEAKHYPISLPDPIEAIKIRMEDLDLKQKDMIGVIGTKGRVSEVLSRKKRLTLEMVRGIHKLLGISLETLIQDYSLTDGKQRTTD